jgi:hypothetical protein
MIAAGRAAACMPPRARSPRQAAAEFFDCPAQACAMAVWISAGDRSFTCVPTDHEWPHGSIGTAGNRHCIT